MAKQIKEVRRIVELSRLIQKREISARELAESCIARSERSQTTTNAFVALDAARILEQADAHDHDLAQGRSNGPLHGIPIAIKDNYLTMDYPTTACSKVDMKRPAGIDATVVARLRQAGAIVFGKTNMHEWAYGATNEISAFGATRNPWNPRHITGGSSGGSAAVLATGVVPASLGSDTGGSVRIPAAACGVCGIKPTYGRLCGRGVLPLSWSLDVPGPMARSAEDLAILLKVMSENNSLRLTAANSLDLGGRRTKLSELKIAVLKGAGLIWSESVARSVGEVARLFENEGAAVEERNIDGVESGFTAWKVILHSEAATYHAHFLENQADDYSENVRVQLEAGRCLSAVTYLNAQQYRTRFNELFEINFSDVDCLILPTLPVTAPRLGQTVVRIEDFEISSQDAMTSLAWIANFTGAPSVSIPCGLDDNGLPIGVMIMGVAGSDYRLLEIASAIQFRTDWHKSAPDEADIQ